MVRVIVSLVADLEGVVDRVTLRAFDDVTEVGVSEMGVAMLMLLGARVVVDGAMSEERNMVYSRNISLTQRCPFISW